MDAASLGVSERPESQEQAQNAKKKPSLGLSCFWSFKASAIQRNSKRSPVVKKLSNGHKGNRTWSPECKEMDRYDKRWYNGEEYRRVENEFRPVRRVDDGDLKRDCEDEGFRRNRNNKDTRSRCEENRSLDVGYKRHSYGTDVEDKNCAKAMVHKDGVSKAVEAFRSSMLWKDPDPSKLPKGNEVLPTFPPNRYSIVPEFGPQVCVTPIATKKKPRFRVNLDVSRYAPEEIIVKIEEGYLVAEGKHFAESDFGYETCEFYRKYPLPEGLDRTDIAYKINSEGVLVVTGGASNESRSTKHHNSLNDETKAANAKRNDVARSAYDNVKEEVPRSLTAVKVKQPLSCGDFKLVDDQTYVLLVNTEGFSPEDMKVKVYGKDISVNGIKKVEERDGSEKRILHKEFTKKFTAPSDADIDSIVSRMTQDGNLRIECLKLT